MKESRGIFYLGWRPLTLCWALATLAAPASASAAQSPPPLRMIASCGGIDLDVFAERRLMELSAPGEVAADRQAGVEAVRKIDELRQKLLEGAPLEAPYRAAGAFGAQAVQSKDPRVSELFRRAAKDQFWREHLTAAMTRAGWAMGLSNGAIAYAYAKSSSDQCGVDADNAAWLQRDIEAHGWYKKSSYGEPAARAAFLIMQHADQNIELQRRALAVLAELVPSGEAEAQQYALLFDRVAVGDGRPQRYGSQGRCQGPGEWREFPVENPSSLDETRAGVGLEPIASYRARFSSLCRTG